MRVKEFYSKRSCAKKHDFSKFSESADKRPLILAKAVSTLCQMLKEGKTKTKEQYENILKYLDNTLRYKAEWYDAPERSIILQEDDKKTLIRLLKFLWGYEIIEADKNCEINLTHPILGGEGTLSQNVSLICEAKGQKVAFIINRGMTDHSPGGKSKITNTSQRIEGMVAKLALEKTYPNIRIGYVYLRTSGDEDGKIRDDFVITTTKSSNVLFADFSSYYKDGEWQQDLFKQTINAIMAEEVKPPCYDCKHSRLCHLKSVGEIKTVAVDEQAAYKLPTYKLPSYTEEQAEVINTTEGQLVCIAGPGSGKTATLVGRIQNILKKGVSPERVLAITYTKKAARELLSRCGSFCEEGKLPYIATINAFAFEVLRANADVIGKRYRALTGVDNLMLIENLLYSYPQIEGIKYGKKYGRFGTLKTVERKLQQYNSMSLEEFKKKNSLGDEFYNFAASYNEAVKQGGYISYDEMITECSNLFKEHPEVLEGYRNLYTYMMVDEYQDVNSDNAELIYLLAGKNGNLCVVGDDDQSIYGFRGGSNRYMLEFDKVYPQAKRIVLTKNFRSTSPIVKLAGGVVAGNARFSKEIEAVNKKGVKPMIVNSSSAETLNKVVDSLVAEGYKHGDIAILSTKNQPLEELHDSVRFPNVLAKTLLIDSAEFILLYTALVVLKAQGSEGVGVPNEILLPFVRVFCPDMLSTLTGDNIFTSLLNSESEEKGLLQRYVELIKGSTVSNLMDVFEAEFSKTSATQTIRELIEEREVVSLEELTDLMGQLVLMEDDSRVEFDTVDAVTLITTHESKGKEWKCVILQNLEDYRNEEESRRMLYVAMTRAKERLYLCHKAKTMLSIALNPSICDVAN